MIINKEMAKVEIEQEELEMLKQTAEKWNRLGNEIETFYFDEDGNERPEDYGDLCDIGEVAAAAFGWL